ncbi:MAG: hypothetical protein R2728_16365 [Chitinophagales bacterium]
MDFNPLTDTLTNNKGEQVKLDEPTGFELPPKGFDVEDNGCKELRQDGRMWGNYLPLIQRLQLLSPFAPWEGTDLKGMKLWIKRTVNVPQSHISMAGPWLV